MTPTQQIALEAMEPETSYTRSEWRRVANTNHLSAGTVRALERDGMIATHKAMDPTTYTITEKGLSALEARNTEG